MSSIEQEIQLVMNSAEQIGKEFTDPDDDWQGVLVLKSDYGNALVPIIFADDDEKAFFATVLIPQLIRQFRPWFAAQVQSAWTVERKLREDEQKGEVDWRDEPRPSEHPDRVETLILVACTANQVQFWSAKIIRFTDKPPKLSPWRLWPDAEAMIGQFITPMVETIKEVNS